MTIVIKSSMGHPVRELAPYYLPFFLDLTRSDSPLRIKPLGYFGIDSFIEFCKIIYKKISSVILPTAETDTN